MFMTIFMVYVIISFFTPNKCFDVFREKNTDFSKIIITTYLMEETFLTLEVHS